MPSDEITYPPDRVRCLRLQHQSPHDRPRLHHGPRNPLRQLNHRSLGAALLVKVTGYALVQALVETGHGDKILWPLRLDKQKKDTAGTGTKVC